MEHEQKSQGKAELVLDTNGIILAACGDGHDGRFLRNLSVGQPVLDNIHSEDRAIFALTLAHVAGGSCGRATIVVRWSRSNGRWSCLLAHFAGDAGCARVTLRSDEALTARSAEAQMRQVVEGSAQGIVVRTAKEVLYINEAFAKMLGYSSPRECIESASSIDSSIHPDDVPLVLRHLQARVTGEETVSNYEFRLLRSDRTEIWVETRAAMVIWDGKPASLSWISDISRRKAMEFQLLRSNEEANFANRTKTEFLAKMSHDLRTPLNAILGFSEIMQTAMCGPLNAKYLEYAGDIHTSGEHLLALVNDVLDLAKLEAGKLELHESDIILPELTEECLALVRGQADTGNIRLAVVVPHALPALRADRRSLKQLLLNLLSNALKFTPDGGTVTVLANGGEHFGITLSVRDTGIGMSAAEIEVALSPFGQIESAFRRTQEGTGLGLPICKSLVELHGGTLHVSSQPGGGTTLSATFPSHRTVARALTCAV